jgi:hypothetical protein
MSNTLPGATATSTGDPIADLLIRNRAPLTAAITADAAARAATGVSPAAAAAAQQQALLQQAQVQGAAAQAAADAAVAAPAAPGVPSLQGMPGGTPGMPLNAGGANIIPYTPPPSGLPWWAWGGFGLVAFGGIAAVQAAKKKKLGKKVPDLAK